MLPRQFLMAKKVGKILSGAGRDDACAVRFTGAPGTKDRITVATMNHLLSSKGIFYRHNTVSQSHAAVHERASQNEKTKFSSPSHRRVSRAWLSLQLSKPKRGGTRSTSPLSHKEISSRHLTSLWISPE